MLRSGASAPCPPEVIQGHPTGVRVLYTDGSVLRSSDPAVCRAGWAFTDARGYGCFGTLPGFAQTINRAELWAVLACASAHADRLVIGTDSQYVITGASAVTRGALPRSHLDLWARFRALARWPHLFKVPAHLDEPSAALRGLPEAVRQGNAQADALARSGASASVFPEDLLESRASALSLCGQVQEAQWRILRAVLQA
ncbi:MAG: hypothetical protein GY772_16110, partial [bacterium]|nr:hypothetical protein [bacterium]